MMELGPAPRARRLGVLSSSTLVAVPLLLPLRLMSAMAFSGVAHTGAAAAMGAGSGTTGLCVY